MSSDNFRALNTEATQLAETGPTPPSGTREALIEQRRKAYEGSALKQSFEAAGHTICDRCYCCDVGAESAPCYQCGGLEDEDDEIGDICSACDGEGELYWTECIGRCDENGNHKAKTSPSQEP
jgi:hypothetical protein